MTLRQVIFGAMRISISCLLRVSRQGPMMSVTSGAGVMSGLPNGWPPHGDITQRVTRASWSGNSFIQINGMLLRHHYPARGIEKEIQIARHEE